MLLLRDLHGAGKLGVHVRAGISNECRVPFLVEIIAPPDFNPALVAAADWADREAGERWPWVTWVRVLKAVDVEVAPTLDHLGIDSSSMQQRARLRTDPDIHGRLVQSLDAISDA